MNADTILERYGAIVDRRLDQILPTESLPPAELQAAMRYSCLAPGKRLRPALCMASAEAVGAMSDAVLDAACAIEMVHCFSLMHDDLPAIDDDDMRRGRPSCHKQFGEALAILAGDALFALAFQTMAATAPKSVCCSVVEVLATASHYLVAGEAADVLAEGRAPSAQEVEFIHSQKTASLMSAACSIGAILGGASDEATSSLRRFGMEVGMAFQIADDLLNELSTADAIGKAAGSDRLRRKATYPSVHGVERSRAAAQAHVDRASDALKGFERSEALLALAGYSIDRLR